MNVENLKQLAMNENGFVFDPSSGYSYTANETGLAILKMLAAGQDKDEIRAAILEEFEVNADNFDSDFDHYTLMLEAFKLVEF
ncbi:MAG: PqqD family protein [Candidatus Cloacimonadaceae bacterium]|jgi:hypothetical protein